MTVGTQRIDLGFVNAYLLQAGEDTILIDTGLAEHWARLESDLLQAECLPARLKLVVITHGDADHAGNGAELQRKYGARIAMHAGDAAMVTSGARVKRQARSLIGKLFQWLGGRVQIKFDTFQPDVWLEDGQQLDGYGLAAKVLHTPGHTKGSLAVLTDDGQLFAGDTLSNRQKPARAPLIENEQELQNSVARLKQTKARVVYPGHGKPFSAEELASIV